MNLHENPSAFRDIIRNAYQQTGIREGFASLLEHDCQQFAKLVPTYSAELPELAYRPVPTADTIETSINTILDYIV